VPRSELMDETSRDEIIRRMRDPAFVLVNVLPAEAFVQGRIPGSLSLPVADIPQRALQVLPDLSADITVYCGGPT